MKELIESLTLLQLFLLIFSIIIFSIAVWKLSLWCWKTKLRNRGDDWLYPVYYDGKYWKKKECDSIFTAFYHSVHSLNLKGGVYLANGDWVYPDGEIEEW